MVENEINNLLIKGSSDCSEMSFLHINCRSLLGNFDKFRVLTTNLSNSFSVIGLSETWLNDNTHDLVNLPGYDFISNHRQNKVGGGVRRPLHTLRAKSSRISSRHGTEKRERLCTV